MTPRGERRAFFGAMLALAVLFIVQAAHAPVLLDDWFQLRYWRDHPLGATAVWEYAHHNYDFYNPRIGEVVLAIVDGSRAINVIATPLVQLAVLPIVFAIAFARWPRPTLRDLELVVFIQTMIWLVIPVPGIMYFYRPIATNYLWTFTITLGLFVPYRLALAGERPPPRRLWLIPVVGVLGWTAGMCNEHTGPTAMVAMACFVFAAWRRRRARAWMVAGMIGLYVGYPMLIFAPGESVRYGGLATHATPMVVLSDRGLAGCIAILRYFIVEARLGLIVFVAALVRYVVTFYQRGERIPALPRRALVDAGAIAAASGAVVVTLFVSPITSDRVFCASGVLLVAAFAIVAQHVFAERIVRRLVVGACVILLGYNAVRFVVTLAEVKAENDARLAILRATSPGTDAVVPSYADYGRTRWQLGDDFKENPWLRDYVGSELFDLARIDVDRRQSRLEPRYVAVRVYDPPLAPDAIAPRSPIAQLPTYRQVLAPDARRRLASAASNTGLARFAIELVGLFDDPQRRPLVVVDWTPAGIAFVEGGPYDASNGHFIRVRRASLPDRLESTYVVGCRAVERVAAVASDDGDVLLPVDERYCRGVFTAIACEPTRCWVAGWY